MLDTISQTSLVTTQVFVCQAFPLGRWSNITRYDIHHINCLAFQCSTNIIDMLLLAMQ